VCFETAYAEPFSAVATVIGHTSKAISDTFLSAVASVVRF
jgi:hypothetical protein